MSSSQTLLGIKDCMISEMDDTSWKTNKIGGKPDWMPNSTCVNIPQCHICDRKMALAVQLYCPLGTSSFDRTLYIYCCINPTCWNKQESWQVYRIQHLPCEQVVKEAESLTVETWLSEELNWDDDCNNNKSDICINSDTSECSSVNGHSFVPNRNDTETAYITDDCSSLTTKLLEISRAAMYQLPWEKSQTLVVAPDYLPLFKSFFISVIEEPPTEKIESDEHIRQLLDSYQGKELHSEMHMGVASGTEIYEKYWINHEDRIFQKFVNRVARCQEQVIRYAWKGEPLLMRKETLPSFICQYCHGPVIYELQLMPALVNFLRLQNVENEDVAVEFGTVMIFTCQRSCWEEDSKFRKENICIQSDPDEELFKQRS